MGMHRRFKPAGLLLLQLSLGVGIDTPSLVWHLASEISHAVSSPQEDSACWVKKYGEQMS